MIEEVIYSRILIFMTTTRVQLNLCGRGAKRSLPRFNVVINKLKLQAGRKLGLEHS